MVVRVLLEIDMVHEFVRWFGQPARVEVDIRDAHAAPLLDIEEEAPERLATRDPQFFDRVARLCGLEHEEALALLFEPGPPVAVAIPALAGHARPPTPQTSDLGGARGHVLGPISPAAARAAYARADHRPRLEHRSHHGRFLLPVPRARVIGVELDRDSAALARSNVGPWSDRTTVVEAAIWSEDGTVTYRRRSRDAWAHHVDSAPAERLPCRQ
jgi:hypothetical protein